MSGPRGSSWRRRLVYLVALLASLQLAALAASCAFAAPGYRGPPSSHFDGERFHNQVPMQHHGFGELLRWQLNRDRGVWEDRLAAPPGPPPPERVGAGELRVTFVNHATTLLQADGVNILTDPIWSERASPLSFIGPERMRPPGIRFDDLPPIDAVLISHNHYDHFDVATLRRLAEKFRPRIIAGLGSRAILDDEGVPGGEDIDWRQTLALSDTVRVTGMPVQHWSRRFIGDDDNTLWTGYVIETSGGPIYFSGDTGWGPHFEQAYERFGAMRLAILAIGAFRPRWFMKQAHISPEEAVDAALVLRARAAVGIHFGTFELGDDGMDEPPAVVRAYVEKLPEPRPNFWILDFGEGRAVPPR